jgi:hypothetical protein
MALHRALLASFCAALVACGTNVDLGGTPSGAEGGAGDGPVMGCQGFAAPQEHARCTACSYACQANGCYDGWFCRTASHECVPPRMACGAGDGEAPDTGHD